MRALSAADVLEVIEWGCSNGLTSTALRLLEYADTGLSTHALAALPIGERDRLLLALRRCSLGGPLVAQEQCPHCASALDITFDDAQIAGADGASGYGDQADDAAPTTREPRSLELQGDGLAIRFRLPTSADLLAVEGSPDDAAATRRLLRRCIERAVRGGEPISAGALDVGALEALDAAMAEADPYANVTVALACPDCGYGFERAFDIAGFFIAELSAVSRELLTDVYTLARGYGFGEAEILAMSPWRRQAYLGMLSS